jgi:hypothetical protein
MVMTPTSRQNIPGRDYGLVALFILFAIVVSVVVTWYLASDGDDAVTTTEVAPVAQPVPASAGTAVETGAPDKGGLAELWDHQAARAAEPIAVYVVSSEDEANRIRAAMADADAIAAGMGLPSIESKFVVLPPDADPWPMFQEERSFRAAEGLPDINVYDLRLQPAESPDTAQAPVVVEAGDVTPVDTYTPQNMMP